MMQTIGTTKKEAAAGCGKGLLRAVVCFCVLGIGLMTLVVGCGTSSTAPAISTENTSATPTDDPIGEELFLDTRFAKYFFEHMTSVNAPLAVGDPIVATVQTPGGVQPGPFAGQSINCRTCHYVTEFQGVAGAGNRTYSDFLTRSAIPVEQNGFATTPRNAMQMVGTFRKDGGVQFLHFDGEFGSGEDLVIGTLTGRNFGWEPTDYATAIAHVANVIRKDDGTGALAADRSNGLSYSILFAGTDSRIPSSILLPPSQRIDVATATDLQVVQEVAMCMAQYFADLQFKKDDDQRYVASPYDAFLNKNHLPRQALVGETSAAYNQRLYQDVLGLSNPIWVTSADGTFAYHDQPFQFGALELTGLKIFLKAAATGSGNDQHAGNCAACHTAPDFTDFGFHNNGVAQEEYDGVHGAGAFMAMHVPGLGERNASPDRWLPRTSQHPNATENFRRPALASDAAFADLGMWNIYLNADYPNPQANLKGFVCAAGKDCSVDQGLASTIALFKTPSLRDLVDSAPYFHNGTRALLPDVVSFYVKSSALAKAGQLRNAPGEFQNMSLSDDDVQALAAFLASLTEDYDDA
jgi:cytochrome c peroxidase